MAVDFSILDQLQSPLAGGLTLERSRSLGQELSRMAAERSGLGGTLRSPKGLLQQQVAPVTESLLVPAGPEAEELPLPLPAPKKKSKRRTRRQKQEEQIQVEDTRAVEATTIGKEEVEKPNFKIPSGYMLVDRNKPSLGLKPIPGGARDKLTVEGASKAASLLLAKEQIPEIKQLMFDKKGELKSLNIFNSRIQIPLSGSRGVPGTKGSLLATMYELGIQAITRAETGAAMPDNELENTRARFMPGMFDSQEVVEKKLELYERTLSGQLKLIRPDGAFDTNRFDAEIDRAKKGPQTFNKDQQNTINSASEAEIRAEAEKEIAKGGDPAAINAAVEKLLQSRGGR